MVPAAEWLVYLPADRGDVDDAATALRAHVRHDQLNEPGQAEDVHLELAARLAQRHVFDRAVGAVAGVVDQHVDPPGRGDDLLDAVGDGRLVGEIHPEDPHAELAELTHRLQTPRDGVNGESVFVQQAGGVFADPGRCTGHERNLGVRHDLLL